MMHGPPRSVAGGGVVAVHENAATVAADSDELRRIELQVKIFGAVTRKAIVRVAGVASETISLWQSRGLKSYSPGTSADWFSVADIAEFMARKESFPGVRKPRRAKP